MSVPFRVAGRGAIALLVTAALLATGLVIGSAPQVARADAVLVQPGELVVNGGGEQEVTLGWTGSLGRATHGVNGYPASVIVDSNGLTGETFPGGVALLTGAGAASVATQTIDLTPSAAAIDNGNVDALVSAYLGGFNTQRDNAQLAYDFFDASGNKVAGVLFGPVLPADRGNVAGFVPFADAVRLPVGARSALITITTQRFVAPANDAYIDNVSLILDVPSPTAAPDAASTNQGVPIVLDPTLNDTPGAGAQIVPSSLRLLDGGVEVTTLTTTDGTYTVDVETGQVTFEPAVDFFGTTTPVSYRITDGSGQQAVSTITIEVAFVAVPGLSVVKSATPTDPADYVLGTEITYSFVVTNTGNVRVDEITISEDAFTGAGEVPVASCSEDSVEPGEQLTCTATYTLVQEDIDNLGVTNTATVSGTPDGFETPVDSDPSTFDIPVEAAPSLALVKSADAPDAEVAGDEVLYSFRVENTGNVTLETVAISESSFSGTGELPDAVCPAGTLVPGAVIVCTAEYELTQADVDAGTVMNTALANASYRDESISSDSSSADVTITPQPSFTFAKTTASTVVTGEADIVEYMFRVSNTGNVTFSEVVINEMNFSGVGDLGAITCPTSTVAPGEHLDCTASYTVVADDLTKATLSNSATADVVVGEATLTSDISTAIVPIEVPTPVPGLSVVKSASLADPEEYVVGTDIIYSFVVTNTGNVRVDGITISEDAFTGAGEAPVAVCPTDSVEPGEQMTCTASYTLVQADIENLGVSNTATVSGTPDGSERPVSSDPSTFEIPVAAAPSLTLVKSAEASGATAAGDEIRYSFVVTNTGNVALDTISITEEAFSGTGKAPEVFCPVEDLLPGAVTTCTADYELTQADVDAGILTNTAIANAAYAQDTVSSDPSSASVTVTPQPTFTFAKTTAADVVNEAGQVIDYVFRVSNTGNVTLTGIVIDDSEFSGAGQLGEITCPASTVAPGEALECTARYIVLEADLTADSLSNSASAEVTAGEDTLESDPSIAIVPIDNPDAELPPREPDGPDAELPPGDADEPDAGLPQGGVDNENSDQSGSVTGRLPSTGGGNWWPLGAGAAFILLLGGVLLVAARRRKHGEETIDRPAQ